MEATVRCDCIEFICALPLTLIQQILVPRGTGAVIVLLAGGTAATVRD